MNRISDEGKPPTGVPEGAARGVPWAMLGVASNRVIMLLSTVALARILAPSDFGLLQVALTSVAAVAVFTTSGFGNAVVLRTDFDRRSLGAVMTLLTGLGVAGAGLFAAASPLIADAFGAPDAQGPIAAVAITLAFGGLTTFYDGIIRRELRFREQFIAQTLQSVAYVIVALSLALLGAGVWSLIGGHIAASLALCVALLALSPYRVRPTWDGRVARSFFSSEKPFLAQSGLSFLSANADYALVGRLTGTGPLGVYSLAFRLSALPNQAISIPVTRVSFPAFARMYRAGGDVAGPYLKTLSLVGLFSCPLSILLSATAEPFVEGILGDKWLAAVAPLAILAVRGAFTSVTNVVAWMFNSVGGQRVHATVTGVTLVLFLPPLVVAAQAGLTEVAWVMLARGVLTFAVLVVIAHRRALIGAGAHLRALRGVLAGCALCWPAAHLTALALDGQAPLLALGLALVAGTASYLAAATIADRELVPLTVRQAKEMFRRGRGPSASAGGHAGI